MLQQTLENIGLNNKEAKVYLAVLELGSNPVSKIAAKAKLNRISTYDIIEKLAKRGLVTSFTRAKVKYFTATDPELVANDFKKRVTAFESSLIELKELKGDTIKPKVISYEGLEGIKTIFADILKASTDILSYTNIKEIENQWPKYIEEFEKIRASNNLNMKQIALDNERGNNMKAYDNQYIRETRLISEQHFAFSSQVFIYDNKVATISSTDQPMGVIIENSDIAKTQRQLFKLTWSSLEEAKPAIMIRKVGNLKTTNNEKAEKTDIEIKEDQKSLF